MGGSGGQDRRMRALLAGGLVVLSMVGCGGAGESRRAPGHSPKSHLLAADAPCRYRGRGLFVTPDPKCTPGEWVDTDGAGVCHKGYNPRPPESVTGRIKRAVMGRYGVPLSKIHDYELDHLRPVWLGGATVEQNLWPEKDLPKSQQQPYVMNPKDADEDLWFKKVCWYHTATVAQARAAFEGDWRKLHKRDFGNAP